MKKMISIVTPVYNEEENIAFYYEGMTKVLDTYQEQYDFEFVLTDNGSTDRTFEMIRSLAQKDSRIRAFRFSRNFGYQKSIYTGFTKARGDAAIDFDCDLQDPPELLGRFLEAWENGAHIVYGVRETRQEGKCITMLRRFFYRFLNAISDDDLPHDAGDFMLLDADIIKLLVNIEDKTPYLRGTIFSLGFKQIGIPYDRRARQHGTSKFPFLKMLSLAIDGIISQSSAPLRLASYLGLAVAVVTVLLSGGYLVDKLLHGATIPAGFTTITLLILFSISLNALFLGIIGEYLARIYRQVRKQPITIIQESIDRSDNSL
ncbi:MAG: glycosyltransferase family 2 protein [Solidesulfovibrio sp.]